MIRIATTDNVVIEYTPNGGIREKLDNLDYFDTPNFISITGAENNPDTAIALFHDNYKLLLTFKSPEECKEYYEDFLEILASEQAISNMSSDIDNIGGIEGIEGIGELFGNIFGNLGKSENPNNSSKDEIPDNPNEVESSGAINDTNSIK